MPDQAELPDDDDELATCLTCGKPSVKMKTSATHKAEYIGLCVKHAVGAGHRESSLIYDRP